MRILQAFAAASIIALIAACSPEAEAPREPIAPEPVAVPTTTTPAVTYTCQSGQSVAVAYPDASTVQLTYQGKTYSLRSAPTASGARYAGSDREWTTVTVEGAEQATLSGREANDDIGLTVLERCTRPAVGPVVPGPVETAPVEGVALAPVATPCKGPQLKLSAEGGDAGAGNRVLIVGVQNVGTEACSLTGYANLVLQDRQGKNLSNVRADQSPGSYLRTGQSPSPVELAPQAKGFFDVAWNIVPNEAAGEKTCPAAATIRATAPGDTSPVSLAQAFSPCSSRVRVSPFRAVAESEATPSPATTGPAATKGTPKR